MQTSQMQLEPGLPNPFLANIAPDAWRGGDTDVPDIHGDVFSMCLAAVETVRTQHRSASVLIHGEQGSGKTHLLSRLQRHMNNLEKYRDLEDDWQIFVYLRMRTASGRIWRKIRNDFVSDLMRRMPDGLTQLDHVLAKRLAARCDGHADLALWWDHHRQNRMDELVDQWQQLAIECDLRADFVQVIEWFIRGQHRLHVRAYLAGGLVSEDGFRKLFGNIDPSHYGPDNEDDAFAAVTSLCHLAGPETPVVFCFDQIEAIESEDPARAPVYYLAKAVADLTDEAPVAAISCVLATFADDAIRAQDRARLTSGGRTALQRLGADQMRQIVRIRVQSSPATRAAAGNDLAWPFGDEEQLFAARRTPRELLAMAAQRFDEMTGRRIAKPIEAAGVDESARATDQGLGDEWEKRIDDAMRNQKPEDSSDLISATLPNLLSIVDPGWTSERPRGPANDKGDLELVLVGPGGEARVGVALCNQPSMISLSAQLRRLIQNRDALGVHKLVLIRDGRLPISAGAKATRDRFDELTKHDGVLLRPSREVMAVLEAVRSLLADAKCGDLSIDGQAVQESSVRSWLNQHLNDATSQWLDEFRLPASPGWTQSDSEFHGSARDCEDVDAVLECLASEPLIAAAQVAEQSGLSVERVLHTASIAGDRIGVIGGDVAVVFRADCPQSEASVSASPDQPKDVS